MLEDLAWLGFVPHDGLVPVRRQSDNDLSYAAALLALQARHNVYVCTCSRKEIGSERYDGRCRHRQLRRGELPGPGTGIRVQLDDNPERFSDLALGEVEQTPARQCGDLLLRDRDGHWTYQFAVTVDDMNDRVDLVIRGLDLLSSTGRQIALARMLGRPDPPRFFHHPLILKADGEKLSKASGDTGIRTLRAAGLDPAEVIGRAAAAVDLVEGGTALPAGATGGLALVRARGQL
jgi:glutamyl-tRNA synthetase/glutamyl-Q tRNA(Asp) synthetase